MTLRDDVWDAVLMKLQTEGEFKISDLPFDESERHTVRRVLRKMEENGWLERESSQAKIWRAGDKARMSLQL